MFSRQLNRKAQNLKLIRSQTIPRDYLSTTQPSLNPSTPPRKIAQSPPNSQQKRNFFSPFRHRAAKPRNFNDLRPNGEPLHPKDRQAGFHSIKRLRPSLSDNYHHVNATRLIIRESQMRFPPGYVTQDDPQTYRGPIFRFIRTAKTKFELPLTLAHPGHTLGVYDTGSIDARSMFVWYWVNTVKSYPPLKGSVGLYQSQLLLTHPLSIHLLSARKIFGFGLLLTFIFAREYMNSTEPKELLFHYQTNSLTMYKDDFADILLLKFVRKIYQILDRIAETTPLRNLKKSWGNMVEWYFPPEHYQFGNEPSIPQSKPTQTQNTDEQDNIKTYDDAEPTPHMQILLDILKFSRGYQRLASYDPERSSAFTQLIDRFAYFFPFDDEPMNIVSASIRNDSARSAQNESAPVPNEENNVQNDTKPIPALSEPYHYVIDHLATNHTYDLSPGKRRVFNDRHKVISTLLNQKPSFGIDTLLSLSSQYTQNYPNLLSQNRLSLSLLQDRLMKQLLDKKGVKQGSLGGSNTVMYFNSPFTVEDFTPGQLQNHLNELKLCLEKKKTQINQLGDNPTDVITENENINEQNKSLSSPTLTSPPSQIDPILTFPRVDIDTNNHIVTPFWYQLPQSALTPAFVAAVENLGPVLDIIKNVSVLDYKTELVSQIIKIMLQRRMYQKMVELVQKDAFYSEQRGFVFNKEQFQNLGGKNLEGKNLDEFRFNDDKNNNNNNNNNNNSNNYYFSPKIPTHLIPLHHSPFFSEEQYDNLFSFNNIIHNSQDDIIDQIEELFFQTPIGSLYAEKFHAQAKENKNDKNLQSSPENQTSTSSPKLIPITKDSITSFYTSLLSPSLKQLQNLNNNNNNDDNNNDDNNSNSNIISPPDQPSALKSLPYPLLSIPLYTYSTSARYPTQSARILSERQELLPDDPTNSIIALLSAKNIHIGGETYNDKAVGEIADQQLAASASHLAPLLMQYPFEIQYLTDIYNPVVISHRMSHLKMMKEANEFISTRNDQNSSTLGNYLGKISKFLFQTVETKMSPINPYLSPDPDAVSNIFQHTALSRFEALCVAHCDLQLGQLLGEYYMIDENKGKFMVGDVWKQLEGVKDGPDVELSSQHKALQNIINVGFINPIDTPNMTLDDAMYISTLYKLRNEILDVSKELEIPPLNVNTQAIFPSSIHTKQDILLPLTAPIFDPSLSQDELNTTHFIQPTPLHNPLSGPSLPYSSMVSTQNLPIMAPPPSFYPNNEANVIKPLILPQSQRQQQQQQQQASSAPLPTTAPVQTPSPDS